MPSESKSQQQAAAIALQAKRGKKDPDELKGASKKMYDNMTKEELEDYAGTKHKDLPENKEGSERAFIKGYINKNSQDSSLNEIVRENPNEQHLVNPEQMNKKLNTVHRSGSSAGSSIENLKKKMRKVSPEMMGMNADPDPFETGKKNLREILNRSGN